MCNENVFRHIQIGKHHRLLINRGNAVRLRLNRTIQRNRFAVEQNFAAVRRMYARHDFDERAFARAIFAEQRVNFAGIQRQRNIVQRLRCIKTLGDVFHFEDGCLGHRVIGNQ